MNSKSAVALLLIIVLFVTAVFANPAVWKKLGKRTVKFTVDRDVIQSGVREGTFTKIKLKVKKSGVHFRDVKVHFQNGTIFDVKIRKWIPKNGETRVIDLPGKNRIIDKVVFWYDSGGRNAKRALVELWARR